MHFIKEIHKNILLKRLIRSGTENISGLPAKRNFDVKSLSDKKVLFIGQTEYFRQNWYDLVALEKARAFDIKSRDPSILNALPSTLDLDEFGMVVMFRPEWMSNFPDVFREISRRGIAMVGYSTEPIIKDPREIHNDELVRLNNLLPITMLPWDLIIHYDETSRWVFESMKIRRVIYNPIPVSSKMFFNMPDTSKKFDFLFVGRSTPYRESFLTPLKARYNLLHVAHGLFDEDVNLLMNQARAVINIHNENYRNFETRIVQALRAKVPLLTEDFPDCFPMPTSGYLKFGTPYELESLAESLMKNIIKVLPADQIPSNYCLSNLLHRVQLALTE